MIFSKGETCFLEIAVYANVRTFLFDLFCKFRDVTGLIILNQRAEYFHERSEGMG